MKLLTTICRLKLEKMYSKTNTSSTIFEKARHGTEKISTARSEGHHITFSRWKSCTAIGGRCKNQCDDSEFRISYCARPTTHCCVTECDPTDPNNWIPKDSVGTQEWYPKDSRH
uniref:Beta-defensin 112 n=1 Tax=Homo sapiens TaxID=9606 RepID=DB112_HUMAN|eukprot:NP_001032587.1 beta-defensin 112 [Homo sapiens]